MENNVTAILTTPPKSSNTEENKEDTKLQQHMEAESHRPKNRLPALVAGHKANIENLTHQKLELVSQRALEHEALNDQYETWRSAREAEIEDLKSNLASRAIDTDKKRTEISTRYGEDIKAVDTGLSAARAYLSKAEPGMPKELQG